MLTFRDGIENINLSHSNSIVIKEIIELGDKIQQFKQGAIPEDKFKSFRLARGVYGQRQAGVQMIRIKIPFGRITPAQLDRISAVSDEYSNGKLHLTTRQDIQIHHVSLDRTPELWEQLAQDDITLREACGNTVRNVTASPTSGIDPREIFDVGPHADLVFRYFLRKPFAQELGRKIKISFSNNELDDAYSFIHDFGFIAQIKNGLKGFKVLIGGGLGAQPHLALLATPFLPEGELLPFIESAIRVFDRHGERNNRNKARLKYLIQKVGLETFNRWMDEERAGLDRSSFEPYQPAELYATLPPLTEQVAIEPLLHQHPNSDFTQWVKTNVIEQKQTGYYGAYVQIPLGNLDTHQARQLAQLARQYSSNDIRITINQNLLFRFVPAVNLYPLYLGLKEIRLNRAGQGSTADITACPGTDTCNLAISNSTHVALVIEQLIRDEFHELLSETRLNIKISGCMNSCGQHGLAEIGLHGSSIKTPSGTLPALQLLLGGGNLGSGRGKVSEKVIKFPSKRILDVLRTVLTNYQDNHHEDESFATYYERQGNRYFYDLLKPLAEVENPAADAYLDWGSDERYKQAIGVGECAGVIIDLVATLFYDAEEKLLQAEQAAAIGLWADATYFAYAAGIHAAKAALLRKQVHCNTHHGIMNDFDVHYPHHDLDLPAPFKESLMAINQRVANEQNTREYLDWITHFLQIIK